MWFGQEGANWVPKETLIKGSTYRPVSGDFNGDGKDDVLLYAPGKAGDTLFLGTDKAASWSARRETVNGSYVPVSGDFNGDSYDDILWYTPGSAPDPMWFGQEGANWVPKETLIKGSTYRPVSGDFNGDGKDDVLLYAPGKAGDTLFLGTDKAASWSARRETVNGSYVPVSGDFNGDSYDDILWYTPGSAPDPMWFGQEGANWVPKETLIKGIPSAGERRFQWRWQGRRPALRPRQSWRHAFPRHRQGCFVVSEAGNGERQLRAGSIALPDDKSVPRH